MEFYSKHPWLLALLQPILRRPKRYSHLVLPLLKNNKTVVDIGCGDCHISLRLQEAGYDVIGLDVVNGSFTDKFVPIVYDGKNMPFADGEFDIALLLMMLHHTPEPATIIAEASRVAKRLIIIEDIYSNKLHKYLTYFFDSLLNLEFRGHPHTNKTDAGWKRLFTDMNLKIVSVSYCRAYIVFRHALYLLEVKS